MVGTEVLEEVGSGKCFDQIGDLFDFQNDDVLDNGDWDCEAFDIDSFPPVWLEESPALSSASARYDDFLQLEWLSNYVQDSLSKPKTFPVCHAKRARSKRPRPATFHPRSAFQLTPPSYFPDSKKKQKIQPYGQTNNQTEHPNAYSFKQCTQCAITETPLWRKGPDGNTLCNACGVRYKSATFDPHSAIQLTPPSYFTESRPLKKRLGPPKKKQMVRSFGESNNQNEHPKANTPRKCTHCEISKTPQWRMGPRGPKTLCNACGVRYKSGRLFPEYRPAASPTFVPSLHSNSHRKVVEMRKSKNEDETIQPNLFKISNSIFPEFIPTANPTFVPSLHSNSPWNLFEMAKSKNGDETIQPAPFEKSGSFLPEYSPESFPLISHQKVVEMREIKNENESTQLDLPQKKTSHKKSLEIQKCSTIVEVPVMIDLTHLQNLVPRSVIDID